MAVFCSYTKQNPTDAMIHPRNILRMIKAGETDRLLSELARNGRPSLLSVLPALEDSEDRSLLALALGLLRCRELTYRLDASSLELLRQAPDRLDQAPLRNDEASRLIAGALHSLARHIPVDDPLAQRLHRALQRFESGVAA